MSLNTDSVIHLHRMSGKIMAPLVGIVAGMIVLLYFDLNRPMFEVPRPAHLYTTSLQLPQLSAQVCHGFVAAGHRKSVLSVPFLSKYYNLALSPSTTG